MAKPTHATPVSRLLTPSDLEALLRILDSHGWRRREPKWAACLEHGFGVGLEQDDALVAIKLAVRSPDGALLGGIHAVDAAHTGRGLGRLVKERFLAEAGDAPLLWCARGSSLTIDEHLGLTRLGTVRSFRAGTPGPAAVAGLPVQLRDSTSAPEPGPPLPNVRRTALAQDGGRTVGHASLWDDSGLLRLGPVWAEEERFAVALMAHLIADTPGPLHMDLPDPGPGLITWLEASGFVELTGASLMGRNADHLSPAPRRIHAYASQALLS